MMQRTSSAALAVALALAACAEPIGPPGRADIPALGSVIGPGVPESAMHFLPHQLTLTTGGPLVPDPLPTTADAQGIETYSLSFWVVHGEAKTVAVDYITGFDSTSSDAGRFLELQFPTTALHQWPDGSSIAAGDSVLVTVDISREAVVIAFGPSGLVFSPSTPPQLDLWYAGAYYQVEYQDSMGIWYEQENGEPWYPLASGHDTNAMRLTTLLMHFSNYSISW